MALFSAGLWSSGSRFDYRHVTWAHSTKLHRIVGNHEEVVIKQVKGVLEAMVP